MKKKIILCLLALWVGSVFAMDQLVMKVVCQKVIPANISNPICLQEEQFESDGDKYLVITKHKIYGKDIVWQEKVDYKVTEEFCRDKEQKSFFQNISPAVCLYVWMYARASVMNKNLINKNHFDWCDAKFYANEEHICSDIYSNGSEFGKKAYKKRSQEALKKLKNKKNWNNYRFCKKGKNKRFYR
ncbi:hypothetical protein KAH94_05625 [bacterium]|nr:hypothetical protein [bacterium]